MRAQTTLDFAIGMSVFLLAVVFVFTFVPGVLEPFEAGPQEETTVADRVASQLVQTSMADPADPYVLGLACTNTFFNVTKPGDAECGFDHTADLTAGDRLTDRVGVADRQRVRVTVEADVDGDGDVHALCFDNDDKKIVEVTDSECGETADDDRTADTDVLYTLGDSPSDTQAVVTAQRTVDVDGHTATVVVEVW
jgi:hypothetical protein